MLVAGAIVFIVARSHGSTASNAPTKAKSTGVPAKQKAVPLASAVRVAAGDFILKAVQRSDATAAYNLSGPDIRGGETLAQWKRDWNDPNVGVPIVPFTEKLWRAPLKLDYSYSNDAQLEVILVSRSNRSGSLFIMGLHKYGKRWLVNYWAPRASPPLPHPE